MHRNKGWARLASVAAIVVAWWSLAGVAAAAVEANSADQSQLETVKGIGPALSGKILAARKQGGFKDWADLENRVSGIGEKNSLGFSRNGLTVAGRAKDGAPASADAGKATRTTTKKAGADGTGPQLATAARKSP